MSWIYRKHFNYLSNRNLHSSVVNGEKNVATQDASGDPGMGGLNDVPLRKMDKRLLVWSGRYKRMEDVPDRMSRAAVAKAQSVCRIKACNLMMLAVIISCGFVIMSGKRDAEKGISVGKMNEQWHEEYNRKYEEEQKKKVKQ